MRTKLTVVLVFVGLCSCLTVGAVAYWMVERDFRETVANHAFERFKADVASYVGHHGSWRAAEQAEPFHAFVQRSNEHPVPEQVIPRAMRPVGDRQAVPPFRYLLLNPEGFVIKPASGYDVGQKVPQEVFDQGVPIVVAGETVALAIPGGDKALTPQDMQYFSAVKKSLVTGSAIAVTFSLLLGLFFGQRLSQAVQHLTRSIKLLHEKKDELHHVEIRTSDELGELAEAFNEMNTDLVEAHRELRELSIRDALTGLYNRRHFDEQAQQLFEQAKRYSQPLSVMIGDLDHFKKINDDFSHEMGDKVLRQVGKMLSALTRKSDIVARYGGEEFVIVFPLTRGEQAMVSCKKIRHAVASHPWQKLHPKLNVTISMGVYDEVEVGSIEKMLTMADQYLYKAKKDGRNRVVGRSES